MRGMRRAALAVTVIVACRPTGDGGDLRPEARAVIQLADTEGGPLTLAEVLGPEIRDRGVQVPDSIRVWRRRDDGALTSCEGRVEVMDLESYVRGVLPSEWYASWESASLDAGAIAARTYGAFWVAAGGKYDCADVDDTTWTQVYLDHDHPRTDAAVARTEGVVAAIDRSLIYAEYSAENGHLTAFGVAEPRCRRRQVDGHGRGMCQWGTQRWALAGRDAAWMVAHYYPGAVLVGPDDALVDGVDLTVRSGERFRLTLTAGNPGPDVWPRESVQVGTEPSAFAERGWSSPTAPAVLRHEVGPGQVAELEWWMRAPDVETSQTFAEFFFLDGPATDRPGGAGSWRITVLPADVLPDSLEVEQAGLLSGWHAVGMLLGLGLLGAPLLLWRRR